MEVSLFSTSSRGLWCYSSESLFLKKIRLPIWHQGSVSISPIKRNEQPLLGQTGLLTWKENRAQVFCSQKDILMVEARSMDEIYDALAERLVPTAAATSDPHLKHIVGLAGPPGSGKSTIACEVAQRVNKLWPQKSYSFDSQVDAPDVATVLPMDGFHLYRHQLDTMENPEEAHARRGAPWTFDPELLLTCLKTLRNQGSVYAPSFDHGVGDPVEDDIYVHLQRCCMCKAEVESANHLLLQCSVARDAWILLFSLFGCEWVMAASATVKDFLNSWKGGCARKDMRKVWRMALVCLLWCLWREKNRKFFDGDELLLCRFKDIF